MPAKTGRNSTSCVETTSAGYKGKCVAESEASRRLILISTNAISAIVALAFILVLTWYVIRRYRKKHAEKVPDVEQLPPYSSVAPRYVSFEASQEGFEEEFDSAISQTLYPDETSSNNQSARREGSPRSPHAWNTPAYWLDHNVESVFTNNIMNICTLMNGWYKITSNALFWSPGV